MPVVRFVCFCNDTQALEKPTPPVRHTGAVMHDVCGCVLHEEGSSDGVGKVESSPRKRILPIFLSYHPPIPETTVGEGCDFRRTLIIIHCSLVDVGESWKQWFVQPGC